MGASAPSKTGKPIGTNSKETNVPALHITHNKGHAMTRIQWLRWDYVAMRRVSRSRVGAAWFALREFISPTVSF